MDQKNDYSAIEVYLTNIIEACGTSIYAALYHTNPSLFFSEQDTWQGYPAHSFHQLLPETIKADVFRNFSSHLNEIQTTPSVNELHIKLTNWCRGENVFRILSDQKSIEEIIGSAFDSGLFDKTFKTVPIRFHTLVNEVGSIEAAATLSSAESIQLYAILISEFAENRSIRLNEDLDFIMID